MTAANTRMRATRTCVPVPGSPAHHPRPLAGRTGPGSRVACPEPRRRGTGVGGD